MRNSYFSEVLHSIKLRGVKFLAVSYWAESCRFSVSFYRDGHWDWLLAVWYCTESLYTATSQQPFLNTFAQAFKGTVAQKYKWILILLLKGYNFYLCTNVLGLHFFLTLCSMILCGVSIFYTKFWISLRKQNQIRIFFDPLLSGPGWFEWGKKLGVENLVGLSL